MIKFLHLLTVIVFCTINLIECSLPDELKKYYDSSVQLQFKEEWKKYRHAFENEIASNLREGFGTSAVNIYEPDKQKAHLLARGFYLTDGVVMVYFHEMVLRELPALLRPVLNIELPSNYVKFDSRLGRMFIDTTYYVARNSTSIIYARPDDQRALSPFSLQQVDTLGKVVIIVDDCLLSGISISTLSGDSVSLGHNPVMLTDCKLTVEISTPNSEAPPVIAPYFPPGPRETIEMILARPIREELQTKMQGAMYSYINTSVLFGHQVVNFRNNQQKLFKSYSEFMTGYVANMNEKTMKEKKAYTLPDYEATMDSETDKSRSKCQVTLTDMIVYGLDTAYVTRAGGPYNDGSTQTAAEAIVFSSMQIRGTLTHANINDNSTKQFAAELTDVTVIVVIVVEEEETKLQQIHFTGWRSVEYSIVPREMSNEDRHKHQSLVYGHILNELPLRVLNHVSSMLDSGGGGDNGGGDSGGGHSGGNDNGGNDDNGGDDDNRGGDDSGGGNGDGSGEEENGKSHNKNKELKKFFSDEILDKNFFSDDNFFSGEVLDKHFFNVSKEIIDKNLFNSSEEILDKNFFNDSKEIIDKNLFNSSEEILDKNFFNDSKEIIDKNFFNKSEEVLDKDFFNDNKENTPNEGNDKDIVNSEDEDNENITIGGYETKDKQDAYDDVETNTASAVTGSDDWTYPVENNSVDKKEVPKLFSDDFMEKDFFSDGEFGENGKKKGNHLKDKDQIDNADDGNYVQDVSDGNGRQVDEDENNIDDNKDEVVEGNIDYVNDRVQSDVNERNIDSNEKISTGNYFSDEKKPLFSDDNKPFFSDDNKPFFSDDTKSFFSDDVLQKDFFSDGEFGDDLGSKEQGDAKDQIDSDDDGNDVSNVKVGNGGKVDEDDRNIDADEEEAVEGNDGNDKDHIDNSDDGNDMADVNVGNGIQADLDEEFNNGNDKDQTDNVDDGNDKSNSNTDGGGQLEVHPRNKKTAGGVANSYFSDDNKPFFTDDVLDKEFYSDNEKHQKAQLKAKAGSNIQKGGNKGENVDGNGRNEKHNNIHTSKKKLFVFASPEDTRGAEFLDKNMFSDMELERRDGSRRHVIQDNRTANKRDPINRAGDHIGGKREEMAMTNEKKKTIKSNSKENVTASVDDSREGKKVVLSSNVHNTRRNPNTHASENEIRR